MQWRSVPVCTFLARFLWDYSSFRYMLRGQYIPSWTNELYRHQSLYVGFSFSWPVNRLCRLEIHSLVVCIFDPACELLPPWMKELYLCTVATLLYLLSDLLPHSPPSQYTVYTDNVWLWGGWGGGWNVLWTIFCRSFTLCFWSDSEPTKLLHHPKQKWPVKTTFRDWGL